MKNLLAERAALQHTITVYVPTTIGEKQMHPKSDEVAEMVDYVAKEMAKRHGGFTVTRGSGGWVNQAGETVHEPVYMVRSNLAEMDVTDTNHAVRIAEHVKDIMSQDLVSLEVDGKLYFI